LRKKSTNENDGHASWLLPMERVVEPGKFANWISPPSGGINGQTVDCEYVRFN
jgi:hypothetical protein